jgi:hypothetical protein
MTAQFAVLYKWTIRAEMADEFTRAWQAVTHAYRTIGALGSRLHRTDDGAWIAYAEWPDRVTWENARGQSPVDAETAAVMRNATLTFEMVPLTFVADLLARGVDSRR